MNNVYIKKIKINNNKYISVNGTLDLISKKLTFNMPLDKFENYFSVKMNKLIMNIDLLPQNSTIYLVDNNDTKYSFYDCIIGFSFKDGIVNVYTTKLNYFLTGKISKNRNIPVNEVCFETKILNRKKLVAYVGNIDFNITNNIKLKIEPYIIDNDLNIKIYCSSISKVKYSILSKNIYYSLELIFLILGIMPNIERIILKQNDNIIELYQETADKYLGKNNNYNEEYLNYICNETINITNLKKFIKYRKKTKILFDMLMIVLNNNGYIEIKNSMLIQLLEGYYKTKYPKQSNKKLRKILEFYYLKNPNTNLLLNQTDKANDYIFIKKAVNHRNYMSHLNMSQQKNVFAKLENNYAYWKLSICVRLYVMQNIGIDIRNEQLNNLIKKINI